MTAKVFRLRPKRHDVIADALQLVLDMPLGLNQVTRDALAEAAARYEPPTEGWSYTMINHEQLRVVLKLINAGDRPATTLRVWTALVSHVRRDQNGVCEIMAGRTRLAEDAETTPQEASRALSTMAKAGILLRLRPSRYALNPHVGWNGPLPRRETAAEQAPKLALVPPA